MLGNDVADLDGPAAGRYGGHIRARLDLVRYDGIGAAGEPLHAPDLDDVRAGSHDVRAHGVQKVGHVHDMGLLGRILNDGHALRHGGGQHNVDGSAYGHLVQENVGPLHPAAGGLRHDKAALGVHLHAQGPEALQVLVDGAGAAEVAASGQRHVRPAEAAQQRAQHVVGGAAAAGALIGDPTVAQAGTVDFHGVGVDKAHLCA